MSDDQSLDDLQELADKYDDLGWHTHAEKLRSEISELEEEQSKSVDRRACEMLAEKHRQREHGDEISELQERLEWYEENGWMSAAEDVRSELDNL